MKYKNSKTSSTPKKFENEPTNMLAVACQFSIIEIGEEGVAIFQFNNLLWEYAMKAIYNWTTEINVFAVF